jgi:hypothetical protein
LIIHHIISICRKIEAKQNSIWVDVYHRIVENVQVVMLKEYGAKLQVSTEFDTSSNFFFI